MQISMILLMQKLFLMKRSPKEKKLDDVDTNQMNFKSKLAGIKMRRNKSRKQISKKNPKT